MQLGAWSSYDDLEKNLTLDELFELYRGIMENKIKEFKNMARANGAKIEDDDRGDVDDGEGWQNVMKKVDELRGDTSEPKKKKENTVGGLFKIKQI